MQSPLLEQLKDIHAVAEPVLWPPAPGWWLLAALLLVGLLYVLRRAWKRFLIARRKRHLMDVLAALPQQWDPAQAPHDYLAAMNRFFRAVALRAFPGTQAVRLQGEEWVDFIQQLISTEHSSAVEVLAVGPYLPLPNFDAAALDRCARSWVKQYG